MGMKLLLPDTNILIYALANIKPFGDHLREWIQNKSLALSEIVVAEFLVHAKPEEETTFNALFDAFGSLPVDTTIARIAASYRKHHTTVRLPDCLIAATAKYHGTTLITFNRRDFPMTDIEIRSK